MYIEKYKSHKDPKSELSDKQMADCSTALGHTQQKLFPCTSVLFLPYSEDVVTWSGVPWTAGVVQLCLLDSLVLGGLWTCVPVVGLCSVFTREMAANLAQ